MRPGGGLPDMQQLLEHAQQMQRDLATAQRELASTEVQGSAAGGLVSATVSGGGEVLSVRIDASVVDPGDVETLQDLVVAAIRDATRQAADVQAEKMAPLTGGLGGSLGDALGGPSGLPELG
jgi:nucleoid-associated protein EbfC